MSFHYSYCERYYRQCIYCVHNIDKYFLVQTMFLLEEEVLTSQQCVCIKYEIILMHNTLNVH